MNLDAYFQLMAQRPELFQNPPECPLPVLTREEDIQTVERQTGRPVGIMYQDQYICLLRDAVRRQNGAAGTYIRLLHSAGQAGVVLLPYTAAGEVVLLRHFRHSNRSFSLELPRGFSETGCSFQEDLRRELREELGTQPLSVTFLGQAAADSGLMAGQARFYAVEVAGPLRPTDGKESICGVELLPLEETERLIRTGEITDGFTLNALYLARLHGLFQTAPAEDRPAG